MNSTIGLWTEENKEIKQKLINFVSGEFAKKIPQIGSIIHDSFAKHPRIWEYATTIAHSDPAGKDVLDVGGLNNLLGWYLHNELNCYVTQLGLSKEDERNFRKNIPARRNIRINGMAEDIRNIKYAENFDIVYCINVIEHVREVARKENPPAGWRHGVSTYWDTRFTDAKWEYEEQQEIVFVKSLARAVKPGGLVVITFDFKDHGGWKKQDKCAYMKNEHDIMFRIVNTSNLKVVGDIDYETEHPVDCHPPASTGIIVLKK